MPSAKKSHEQKEGNLQDGLTNEEGLALDGEIQKENGCLTLTFFMKQNVGSSNFSVEHHHHVLAGMELSKDSEGDIVVVRREEYQTEEDGIPKFKSAKLKSIHGHHDSKKCPGKLAVFPNSKSTLDGILKQLSAFDRGFISFKLVDISCENKQDEETFANYNQALAIEPDQQADLNLGVTFGQLSEEGENVLIIQSIEKSSWFSCMEEGQIVLSINGKSCDGLSPYDALTFLQCKKETSPFVSIETIPSDALIGGGSSIKRTAVAVSGSATVAVGAVLMVTPLHPVGHVMTVGGMGILATEFRGPRNVLNRLKCRFSCKDPNQANKSKAKGQKEQKMDETTLLQDEGVWRSESGDTSFEPVEIQ